MVISTSREIHIEETDLHNLWFDEDIPYLAFESSIPFLCDTDYNVLFGNYFLRDTKKKAKVIIISNSRLLEEGLWLMEKTLTEEKDIGRLTELDRELRTYLKNEMASDLQLQLFDLSDTSEKRLISKENYIMPPERTRIKIEENDNQLMFDLFEEEEEEL